MSVIVIFLGALLYAYESILRVSLSTIKPELTLSFGLTASMFGTLSALFFYAYAPLQMVVGVLIDHFKTKIIVTLALLTCISGTLLFANTHSYYFAGVGRFLQGVGAAFCYILALKIAAVRATKKYFPLCVGIIAAVGFIAAGIGQITLSHLLVHESWRQVLLYLVYAGFALLALFSIFVRSTQCPKVSRPSLSFNTIYRNFCTIFQIPQLTLIILFATCLFQPTTIFADLWGIPYLEVARHYTAIQAATGTSMIFYGWAAGSILSGMIAIKMTSRVLPVRIGAFCALFLSLLLLYVNLPVKLMYSLFFIFGVVSAMQTLCYVLIKESGIVSHLQATAMASLNFLVSMAGLIFQQGFGYLLDMFWSHHMTTQHMRLYAPKEYEIATAMVPIILLLGVWLSCRLNDQKETIPLEDSASQTPVLTNL